MTDYILKDIEDQQTVQTAVFLAIIILVCISIPGVIILACCAIWCEARSKREIQFISEWHLTDTLKHDVTRDAFQKYCEKELCAENVKTWRAVQEFREIASDKRTEKAQSLLPLLAELNITKDMKEKLEEAVSRQSIGEYMFEGLRTNDSNKPVNSSKLPAKPR